MQVELLSSRNEVIDATIRVMQSATSTCVGMGRQIAWIELPAFRDALDDRLAHQVTVRVIGVEEGEVDHFTGQFEEVGVPVRYYEHGDVRVALADSQRAVLALPSPCTGVHTRRAYMGLYVEDPLFGSWLQKRFDEIWDVALPARRSFWNHVIDDFRKNPAVIIAGVGGAVLGALAAVVAALLTKAG